MSATEGPQYTNPDVIFTGSQPPGSVEVRLHVTNVGQAMATSTCLSQYGLALVVPCSASNVGVAGNCFVPTAMDATTRQTTPAPVQPGESVDLYFYADKKYYPADPATDYGVLLLAHAAVDFRPIAGTGSPMMTRLATSD